MQISRRGSDNYTAKKRLDFNQPSDIEFTPKFIESQDQEQMEWMAKTSEVQIESRVPSIKY